MNEVSTKVNLIFFKIIWMHSKILLLMSRTIDHYLMKLNMSINGYRSEYFLYIKCVKQIFRLNPGS